MATAQPDGPYFCFHSPNRGNGVAFPLRRRGVYRGGLGVVDHTLEHRRVRGPIRRTLPVAQFNGHLVLGSIRSSSSNVALLDGGIRKFSNSQSSDMVAAPPPRQQLQAATDLPGIGSRLWRSSSTGQPQRAFRFCFSIRRMS